MKKYKVIPINDFVNSNFERKQKKINYSKVRKVVLVTGGLTVTTLLAGFDVVNASTGIDIGAKRIYDKLLNIGKWIIIVKGAIDTINHMVQGESHMAKRSFLSYLIIYLILNGLPWAMDQVDTLFKEISDTTVKGSVSQ